MKYRNHSVLSVVGGLDPVPGLSGGRRGGEPGGRGGAGGIGRSLLSLLSFYFKISVIFYLVDVLLGGTNSSSNGLSLPNI